MRRVVARMNGWDKSKCVYDAMAIHEAIEIAKANYQWPTTGYNEPTSVDVGFLREEDGEFYEDETQFDLWGNDNEKDLSDLWATLCTEFSSKPDNVLYVESYGYIVD